LRGRQVILVENRAKPGVLLRVRAMFRNDLTTTALWAVLMMVMIIVMIH
jgi:hypothetical protein